MAPQREIPPRLRRHEERSETPVVFRQAEHVRSASALRTTGAVVWGSVRVLTKIAVLIAIIGLIAIFGRSVSVPERFLERIETRLNQQFVEAGLEQRVTIRRASFGLLGDEYRPTIRLDTVQFFDPENNEMLRLPEVRSELGLRGALQGQAVLRSVSLDGASVQLERDENGQIVFALGAGFGAMDGTTGGLGEVLAQIDPLFERPILKELDVIRASGLAISMLDRRTGQLVEVQDGEFVLENKTDILAAELTFGLAMQDTSPAQLRFSAQKDKGRGGARLVAEFSDLSTRDLAAQVGALNWMKALDAPAGGTLRAVLDEAGNVSDLTGSLSVSNGFIRPDARAVPVEINSASARLRYSVSTGRLFVEDVVVDAPEAKLAGSGHLDLLDLDAMVPQTVLAQLRLHDIEMSLEDVFDDRVAFERGAVDLRYRPGSQQVEIGQVVLQSGETEIVASGDVGFDANGWRAALDAQVAGIKASELLALWPKSAAFKTRNWLTSNIIEGDLSNAAASLRLAQGQKPRQAVTFNFRDARVRYMKTLPPIENGIGYGAITGTQFVLNLHSGDVRAPDGNRLDVSGSTLEIANMAVKPAVLEVDLNVRGNLQGTLALLDEKPFEFLSKGGLDSKIATGSSDIVAALRVPLVRKLKVDQVEYDVSGSLLNVRSDVLAKGRVIDAERLAIVAGDGRLSIGGPGRLDGTPMDAAWSRAIGKGSDPTGRVEGWVELSDAALATFGVKLPRGMVSGTGRADVDITLAKGEAPQLVLNSDLQGVGMSIAALGWSKSRNSKGALAVELALGPVPEVKDLRIDAAGLSTRGSVRLNGDGSFDRVQFSPLQIAGRFNSDVEIASRGRGRPVQIAVNGGQLDVRKFGVSGGGGGGGAGPPIKLNLDRLIISDSISLHGFRADFSNNGGLKGPFRASVNGQAAVSGVLTPTSKGPAIDIASSDGGAVMRGSGIFRNAKGGDMTLRLQPTGRAGEFSGKLEIENTRVVNAPALAELLSALSVVGILEQLGSGGIPFGQVQADFVLGKSGVTIKSSSAVGASMGISMEGIYDTNARRMDLQGVVSPIYAVNGLFGAMFAPRRGEGLFGFNYTLKGSADDPKVGVNPLSMLTPGIFREIFRQPPPKL